MTLTGLMECIASEFAESYSRKLGHTDRHWAIHMCALQCKKYVAMISDKWIAFRYTVASYCQHS